MKKLVLSSVLAVSLFSVAAFAEEVTGFVSDSKCGAKHTGAEAKDATCPKVCIKGGADAVLVSDGKVMKIDADSQAKAKPMAGENVKVEGTVSGDTITIASISPVSK